jgi:hypothetical protein
MPEQVPVKVLRTGGVDYLTVPTAEEALIEALERERQGYVQRGLDDRVAAVDAELAKVRQPEAAAEPPQTTSRKVVSRTSPADKKPNRS